MKNQSSRNLITAAVVVCLVASVVLLYTFFNVFYVNMPADEMHRNVGSDFECLGCHNRARSGGDSFVYHFKEHACRKCHSQ